MLISECGSNRQNQVVLLCTLLLILISRFVTGDPSVLRYHHATVTMGTVGGGGGFMCTFDVFVCSTHLFDRLII